MELLHSAARSPASAQTLPRSTTHAAEWRRPQAVAAGEASRRVAAVLRCAALGTASCKERERHTPSAWCIAALSTTGEGGRVPPGPSITWPSLPARLLGLGSDGVRRAPLGWAQRDGGVQRDTSCAIANRCGLQSAAEHASEGSTVLVGSASPAPRPQERRRASSARSQRPQQQQGGRNGEEGLERKCGGGRRCPWWLNARRAVA